MKGSIEFSLNSIIAHLYYHIKVAKKIFGKRLQISELFLPLRCEL